MLSQSNIVKVLQGRAIRINPVNQYVCLSDIAQATEKSYAHWYQLEATAEYLKEFEGFIGIPIDELISIDNLSSNEDCGTWAHPKIAIRFAQWCSVKFAIQMDFWIDELLNTGKVEIEPTQKVLPFEEQVLKTAKEFPEDKWYGVVADASARVELGQFVADLGFERVREERLCNGQLTEIWCYCGNDDVRSAIAEWSSDNADAISAGANVEPSKFN